MYKLKIQYTARSFGLLDELAILFVQVNFHTSKSFFDRRTLKLRMLLPGVPDSNSLTQRPDLTKWPLTPLKWKLFQRKMNCCQGRRHDVTCSRQSVNTHVVMTVFII